MKIAIVGGGISGLATAFYLRQSLPDAHIVLFEKESTLGGKMLTKEVEGFFFEAGSNGFPGRIIFRAGSNVREKLPDAVTRQ